MVTILCDNGRPLFQRDRDVAAQGQGLTQGASVAGGCRGELLRVKVVFLKVTLELFSRDQDIFNVSTGLFLQARNQCLGALWRALEHFGAFRHITQALDCGQVLLDLPVPTARTGTGNRHVNRCGGQAQGGVQEHLSPARLFAHGRGTCCCTTSTTGRLCRTFGGDIAQLPANAAPSKWNG